MDAAWWSGFPFEIVEQVLSFLQVPHLCKYQSVCMAWNQLIQSPRFEALFAQNATKQDASFSVLKGPELPGERHNVWCFLDLDAKQWYSVDDENLCCSKYSQCIVEAVAMDGGLAC